VAVRRYQPAHAGPGTIAFFHGGGWMLGDIEAYDILAGTLFYPVLDCANERPSYHRYARGHVLTAETIRYLRREYVPEADRRHEPGASPLLAASLDGCPPAYVCVARCDVLRDEGVAYAERLPASGVDVTLEEVPGTLHGFVSLLGLREARGTLTRASTWLSAKLAAQASA
jgi:acetyl esterase